MLAVLAACGGGDGQLSVTISGLSAAGLVLDDGTETISVASGATSATFPTLLVDGTDYNVVVDTQPAGLFCTVSNGSGTVSSSTPSANITVSCAASYTMSGTVSNLKGSGLVITNGSENLPIAAGDGTFAFANRLNNGTVYTLEVVTAPSSPAQTCTFTNGTTGTVNGASITTLALSCTP
jgi:hypothetical protein